MVETATTLGDDGPAVALIATVKDEAGSVGRFLDALQAQTRAADEVVIVDGGSTDGTLEALRERARTWPALRVVEAPGTTISAGRNRAVEATGCAIVAVTDAGAVARSDWLDNLVRPLLDDPGVAVASGWFEPGGEAWFEQALGAVITPHLAEVRAEDLLPSSRSVAFRREWWARVGGYPEWLTHCEDLVFDLDLRASGARFAFAPDAVVVWLSRRTLGQFFRQYLRYARGDGVAGLWPKRHAIRYGSYAAGAVLAWPGPRAARRRGLLGLLAAAYLAKFWRRTWRHLGPRRDLPAVWALVPVVVVTGDVAKMLGYPVGLLRRRDVDARRAIARR